jgi:hypothetical protein
MSVAGNIYEETVLFLEVWEDCSSEWKQKLLRTVNDPVTLTKTSDERQRNCYKT